MVHAMSLLDHPSKSMPMMTQQSMPIPKMKDIALPFGESLMICQSCSRTQSYGYPLCHRNKNMLCFHSYTRIPATLTPEYQPPMCMLFCRESICSL